MKKNTDGSLTLTLGGEQRTLFFDYLFVSLCEEKFGTFDQALEHINANAMLAPARLIYLGLLVEPGDNKLPDDFSEKTVLRWLRGMAQEDLLTVVEVFQEAMGFIRSMVFGLAAKVAPAALPEAAAPEPSVATPGP